MPQAPWPALLKCPHIKKEDRGEEAAIKGIHIHEKQF